MFKATRFPPGICGAQAEREHGDLAPKKMDLPLVQGTSQGECAEQTIAEFSRAGDASPIQSGLTHTLASYS
jgi:hypothetical protein